MGELVHFPYEPSSRWSYADINALLLWGAQYDMSDALFCSGGPVWLRIHGKWRAVTRGLITADELFASLERLTKNNSIGAMLQSSQQDFDFAHQIEVARGIRRRYRGNAMPVADGYATGVKIVFRAIPSEPPALASLGVEQGILDHATPDNGLVLVTGVMGSGKSTLLAGILRDIIERGGRHVATYEAPIEFDLRAIPNPGGPVSQSTIPEHLQSFMKATRNSTRTAPDVVLIGESRDPETLRGMIESAEIGVAAYSTVHTRSVPETISRIINVFPNEERRQLTATLLSSLRLVVSQRLLPLSDGSGRVALREFLAFTPEIRETLLETPLERLAQKTEQLLAVSGQRIQDAAEKAFAEEKISKDKYLAILAERTSKTGGKFYVTTNHRKTPILRGLYNNRVPERRGNKTHMAAGWRSVQKQRRIHQPDSESLAVA
jgi:Tfp pilus assembly protein, pilus retraction ATPase PilT